jgi:hypothetical protein
MGETLPERGKKLIEKAKPRLALFETIALVLLSMATIGTAWCSYQAASWSGVAQGLANRSAAASRKAAAVELQAQQVAILDVLLFSQYINARLTSNATLSAFYAARFRDEAKTAFDAWMQTQPFENPAAPPHPFTPAFYQPRLLTQSREAAIEGQSLSEQAGNAGRTSRNYVLITVLLASALFSGGTASKFETGWVRRAVVILGMTAFLFAVEQLWRLPIQL